MPYSVLLLFVNGCCTHDLDGIHVIFSKAWPQHLLRSCMYMGSDLIQCSALSLVSAAFGSVFQRHILACTAVWFGVPSICSLVPYAAVCCCVLYLMTSSALILGRVL